ncbi:AlpA family phage regulatory protein [uncultured Roseovarius sp.]|uniref:helix-turn-helix transcriptional regulator n=1 Tax=uncultured Roseovarius sp. TaxID=293344 RepID=UPI003414597F
MLSVSISVFLVASIRKDATLYLSDEQLAARYNVSRGTVWRWHRTDPTFPRPVKLSPGCTRWKLAEVEAWEAAQAEPGTQARVC